MLLTTHNNCSEADSYNLYVKLHIIISYIGRHSAHAEPDEHFQWRRLSSTTQQLYHHSRLPSPLHTPHTQQTPHSLHATAAAVSPQSTTVTLTHTQAQQTPHSLHATAAAVSPQSTTVTLTHTTHTHSHSRLPT